MHDPTERTRLIDQLVDHTAATCVRLDTHRDPLTHRPGHELLTTTDLLAAEHTLLDAAEQPRRVGAGLSLGYALDREANALDALSSDQRASVEAVVSSRSGLDVQVGPAGAGKTTTLDALARVWRAAGGRVTGLAPSASAAHTLQGALGVDCHTTAKWLYETVGQGAAIRATAYAEGTRAEQRIRSAVAAGEPLDRVEFAEATAAWERAVVEQEPWRLSPADLLIVDEASLADTRTLAELATQARAAGAKVLLVGDHLQRGAVAAGGAFGMLARRGPTAELTSLWRFAHPWEARASLALRHAQPEALDAYEAHGAISAGPREDMLDAALARCCEATDTGRVALLQAANSRTVRDLNAAAHARAVLDGRASSRGGVPLHDGLIATVGDRVVTRRNDRRLRAIDGSVRNGELWRLETTHPDGSVDVCPLRAHQSEPTSDARAYGLVHLPEPYVAEHLELGYAVTTARSQGPTVDETHTIAAPGMGREDLYVAMSRGRGLNRVYVATDLRDDDCLTPAVTPPAASPTGREVLTRILATSHAELSATETWASFRPGSPSPIPSLDQLRAAHAQRRSKDWAAHVPSPPAPSTQRSLW